MSQVRFLSGHLYQRDAPTRHGIATRWTPRLATSPKPMGDLSPMVLPSGPVSLPTKLRVAGTVTQHMPLYLGHLFEYCPVGCTSAIASSPASGGPSGICGGPS